MNEILSTAFINTEGSEVETIVEPGKEREFLQMLLRNLDVGVGILDQDMRYRMLSNASLRNLKIDQGEIGLGDPLTKMHELMMEKGLMNPEIMAKNSLSEEQHRTDVDTGTVTTSKLVKLGDGSTHRFCRQVLENGYTISVATDVSELVEKDELLESALMLGRSGIWTYDFETKSYALSKSMLVFFGPERVAQIQATGFMNAIVPEDRPLLRDALKNIAKTNDKFEINLRCIIRDGSERWCSSVTELIRDKTGRPLRLRAFVKDTHNEHLHQMEMG